MSENTTNNNTEQARPKGPGLKGQAGFGRKGSKPRDIKGTTKRILSYAKDYRLQLTTVAICITISTTANVVGTFMLRPFINEYIEPFIGKQNVDLSGFLHLIILMAGIYLVGVAATYTYNRLMINISTGILLKIRTDMYDHMMAMPLGFFDSNTHGEIMSRYTNDTDALREMLSQGLPQLFSSLLGIASAIIMMLVLSPLLTLLVAVMVVLMLLSLKMIGSRSGKNFAKQQKELGQLNGYIEEMIAGVKVVKVFGRENQVREGFDDVNDELLSASRTAHTYANVLMPVLGNLSYLNYALVATAGAALAINGYMDLGTIASFLQYTRNFAQPLSQISQLFNSLLMALAGAERIFAQLDIPMEEDGGTITLIHCRQDKNGELVETNERSGQWAWKEVLSDGSIKLTLLAGDVRFEDVLFGYEPEKTVLKNVSLYAKPGQKIAFVGSTGAGKTTITNLINRFYEIDSGAITYDGIDIRRIAKPHLRRSLGMVLQDTHLFTGTVMENIRYGRLDATDEECIEAAVLANADYFIQLLPNGYQTILSEGARNLSQGQRQLLAIARAAVSDPPVLILDEATSSIDTRSEALIEKGMDKLMEGRTVFVIAHRLSTVRNAKAIMVLEDGKIIERGEHDTLLKEKGRYYQLYTGSFELE